MFELETAAQLVKEVGFSVVRQEVQEINLDHPCEQILAIRCQKVESAPGAATYLVIGEFVA